MAPKKEKIMMAWIDLGDGDGPIMHVGTPSELQALVDQIESGLEQG